MADENYFHNLSFLDKVILNLRNKEVRRYIQNGDKIADLGAGNGAFLKSISDQISQGFAMDRYAAEKNEGNIRFIPFDLDEKNSALIQQFHDLDLVTAQAVIEHIRSPFNLMRLSFDMLRPGGRMIVTTPTPRSRTILELLAFKLHITNSESLLEHRQYLWGYELYHLAKDAGFSSVSWHEFEMGMNTFLVATK